MGLIVYRFRRQPPPPRKNLSKLWFLVGLGLLALLIYGCVVAKTNNPAVPPPVNINVQPGNNPVIDWNKVK